MGLRFKQQIFDGFKNKLFGVVHDNDTRYLINIIKIE